GPVAFLLSGLAERSVPVALVAAGDERRFGAAHWQWLHPPAGWRPRRLNSASQAVRVQAAGRTLLLCGDNEEEGLGAIQRLDPTLSADIVELPHHGSWRAAATEFVVGLRPSIVLQSTGPRRLRPDR